MRVLARFVALFECKTRILNVESPHPRHFFVRADFKGVIGEIFVRATKKGLTGELTVQGSDLKAQRPPHPSVVLQRVRRRLILEQLPDILERRSVKRVRN